MPEKTRRTTTTNSACTKGWTLWHHLTPLKLRSTLWFCALRSGRWIHNSNIRFALNFHWQDLCISKELVKKNSRRNWKSFALVCVTNTDCSQPTREFTIILLNYPNGRQWINLNIVLSAIFGLFGNVVRTTPILTLSSKHYSRIHPCIRLGNEPHSSRHSWTIPFVTFELILQMRIHLKCISQSFAEYLIRIDTQTFLGDIKHTKPKITCCSRIVLIFRWIFSELSTPCCRWISRDEIRDQPFLY